MVALEEGRRDPVLNLSFLMPFRTTFDVNLCNARESIDALRSSFRVPIFKIGTATNPRYRFYNSTYGYRLEHFSVMAVLCQQMPAMCAQLETALIAHYLRTPGCQNILLRANAPKEPPCYVYVVMCDVDIFVPRGAGRSNKRGRITYH